MSSACGQLNASAEMSAVDASVRISKPSLRNSNIARLANASLRRCDFRRSIPNNRPNNLPNHLPLVHQIKRLVDLVQRQHLGHHLVDLDLAGQVTLDVARKLRAP